MQTPLDLVRLQDELRDWVTKNFRDIHGVDPLNDHYEETLVSRPILSAVKEIGELSHAFLKMMQGIRGTREDHEADMKDAIGDTVVYLIDVCSAMGWSFEEILRVTSEAVMTRDWTKHPKTGGV